MEGLATDILALPVSTGSGNLKLVHAMATVGHWHMCANSMADQHRDQGRPGPPGLTGTASARALANAEACSVRSSFGEPQ